MFTHLFNAPNKTVMGVYYRQNPLFVKMCIEIDLEERGMTPGIVEIIPRRM